MVSVVNSVTKKGKGVTAAKEVPAARGVAAVMPVGIGVPLPYKKKNFTLGERVEIFNEDFKKVLKVLNGSNFNDTFIRTNSSIIRFCERQLGISVTGINNFNNLKLKNALAYFMKENDLGVTGGLLTEKALKLLASKPLPSENTTIYRKVPLKSGEEIIFKISKEVKGEIDKSS